VCMGGWESRWEVGAADRIVGMGWDGEEVSQGEKEGKGRLWMWGWVCVWVAGLLRWIGRMFWERSCKGW
jgi:hypothetical protein